jgi:hypothetical protein
MPHRVRFAATFAGGLWVVRRGHGEDISQDQNSGVFGMHRTYNYKDFTIEVETEAMAGIAGERVPATPVGYIADVNITKSGSPAATRRLHFGEDAGRPFGTPAEALMRGYGVAQQVIDGMKNAVDPPSVSKEG